jgi:hypothetical protein
MFNVEVIEAIQSKYTSFLPYLNERTRRAWAAMEAIAMGNGGVSVVAQATGLSRNGCDLNLIQLKGERKTILVELIPELTPTSRC